MARRDRLIRERKHDPYRAEKKLAEPSVCSECRALYRAGRWVWAEGPARARQTLCPACQRVREDEPAGVVSLVGDFHLQHRAEILGLMRHVEDREARAHALKRIMRIVEQDDRMEITTTDASLARSLGDAIHHAYQGELDYHYPDPGGVLRVRWTR